MYESYIQYLELKTHGKYAGSSADTGSFIYIMMKNRMFSTYRFRANMSLSINTVKLTIKLTSLI